jgi:putative endonuclease
LTAQSPVRPAWVYILECADGTFYTGWCYDIEARLAAHHAGRAARYTRGRRPVRLRWSETHTTRHDAMRREIAIKRLTRAAKLELIEGNSHVRSQLEEPER